MITPQLAVEVECPVSCADRFRAPIKKKKQEGKKQKELTVLTELPIYHEYEREVKSLKKQGYEKIKVSGWKWIFSAAICKQPGKKCSYFSPFVLDNSALVFFRRVLRMWPEDRTWCVMVQPEVPVRLYLDLEQTISVDERAVLTSEYNQVAIKIANLAAAQILESQYWCRSRLQVSWVILSNDRKTSSGQWKISRRVLFHGAFFPDVHYLHIWVNQTFKNALKEHIPSWKSAAFSVDQILAFIDFRVYTTWRQLRLPNCVKPGEGCCFQVTETKGFGTAPDDLTLFLLGLLHPIEPRLWDAHKGLAQEGYLEFEDAHDEEHKLSPKKKKPKEPKEEKRPTLARVSTEGSSKLLQYQEVIEKWLKERIQLEDLKCQWIQKPNYLIYSLHYYDMSIPHRCPVNPEVQHHSNGAYFLVSQTHYGGWRLKLRCHSQNCKEQAIIEANGSWRVEPTPQYQQRKRSFEPQGCASKSGENKKRKKKAKSELYVPSYDANRPLGF